MTTAVQVQYRRGTQSQMAAFTGAAGEMDVDTTNNRVVVQDGVTAGGWPAAKLSEIAGGHLSKFRNGTMDVWQRGTSALTATTAGAYTADGWIVLPAGASVTAAQAGGRLLTKNSLQVTGAASVTDLTVKQRIESLIAAAFCSQTVTVQAQVYNNTGGAITPKLTVNRPSAQDNYTSVTADVNAVSLQSCANGAWTQIAYTFQANAASYNGIEIAFDFGNNFGSSGKTIQITECDIRLTNGIPAGQQTPSNFVELPELRPIAGELMLCQRYFETSYPQGTALGTVTVAGRSTLFILGGALNSVMVQGGSTTEYKATKRTSSPTVTFYSPVTGASGFVRDYINNTDVSPTLFAAGDGSFGWAATMSSAGTSFNFGTNWTSSAEL
jgi:hypothetical protein